MERQTKMEALRQIIDREFEANIMHTTKKQNHVDGRKIFCKVLYEAGFSTNEVSRFLKKSVAMHTYYLSDVDILMKYRGDVYEKYLKCKELFLATVRGIIYEQNTYIVGRKPKIDYSVWDKENLTKIADKYDRIKNIIDLVDFNTPIGKENLIFKRLAKLFNSSLEDGEEER